MSNSRIFAKSALTVTRQENGPVNDKKMDLIQKGILRSLAQQFQSRLTGSFDVAWQLSRWRRRQPSP